MDYLITGGAGFIGSHLADALADRGDRVLILDNLSTGSRENVEELLEAGAAELVEGSTSDTALVDECMRQVDACFHLASAVGVQLIVDRSLDSLLGNVEGCRAVVDAAHRSGNRLLFTSTSEIYGKNTGAALHEEADRVMGPPSVSRWSYSTAKAFGEAVALGYHRERGSDTVVSRLFNTVGPRQSGAYGMVLPRLVGQALTGEDLTVYGDGSQSRCFCHVADTVRALIMLMDETDTTGSVFNVGRADETTILELAETVLERTKSQSEIRTIPYEEAYGDGFAELGERRPDTTAIAELTGWEPRHTVEEAIDDVAAYERSRLGLSLEAEAQFEAEPAGRAAAGRHATSRSDA